MERELIRVQRLGFAGTLGVSEQLLDRVVESSMKDGLEATFGCVELVCGDR